MFTTGAGKPLTSTLTNAEQILVDQLCLSPKLYSQFQENFKAASFLNTISNLAIPMDLNARMIKRFQQRTYLNSSIRKLKSGDIPAGCHLVLAVSEVKKDASEVVLTDFFQFVPLKFSRDIRLNVGDFVRLSGARFEMGVLYANPNGIIRVTLEVPIRVSYFGVQNSLPPVPRLASFVAGEIPYLRAVVFRNLKTLLVAVTENSRYLLAEEDREDFIEMFGPAVTRLELSYRALITDPWGTRFAELSFPGVQGDDGESVDVGRGDAMDLMNCRLAHRNSFPKILTNRGSMVGKSPVKYFLNFSPPPSVCCDLLAEVVSETSEGVFQVDGLCELRLDFKPALFNARRRLNSTRKKLLQVGSKTLQNLRKCDYRVYFADVNDIVILFN